MAQKKTTEKKDSFYSTYWWEIWLDKNHFDNSPRVEKMTGYSKYKGMDEAKDKEYLLMSRIKMLFTNGYLSRCKMIEIFWKKGDVVNKKTDPKIVTLYSNTFMLEPHYLSPKFNEWQLFLRRLYDVVRTGKGMEFLLPEMKAGFSKDDYLNIDKYFFTSIEQLQNHCTKLGRNGHPFPAIEKFHRDYLAKKPFK